MTTDRREQQLPVNTVEVSFDIEIEHPVVSPAALTGLAHCIDRRFAGSVAVGVRMEYRLQNRLQVTTDNLLGDAVSNRWHSHIELHFDPVSLWVRLRSLIRFIRFAVTGLLF